MNHQIPPRPEFSGFAQRLWDNMYNPDRFRQGELGNSLKTDVHSQLRKGSSLRQLLKLVETVLEEDVSQMPCPATMDDIQPAVDEIRARDVQTLPSAKKARFSIAAPTKMEVRTTLSGRRRRLILGKSLPASSVQSPAKSVSFKDQVLCYMKKRFILRSQKEVVQPVCRDVVKQRKHSAFVSTMASLLY